VLQLFAVSVSLSEILNHQANVSGSKYNKDNNNELFHHENSFRLNRLIMIALYQRKEALKNYCAWLCCVEIRFKMLIYTS